MRRALYPANWEAISAEVRARAAGRCECMGRMPPNGCGLHRGHQCCERHGEAGEWMRGRVVLTVHHTTHNKRESRRRYLLAMCQRCHLRADAPLRSERRKAEADARSGQTRLWPLASQSPERPDHAR